MSKMQTVGSLARRARSIVGIGAVSMIAACGLSAADDSELLRSPVNQVFQFMQSGTCTEWADGSKTNATAYLWIPEKCKKLRGLVIMCTNVPEHMLVGHPAIRKACADNDLGIVWSVPSFFSFKKDADNQKINIRFLEQLLGGLAKVSGYEEVATVPWLPMGESRHLLMVCAALDQRPERCIAGVCIKNPQYPKDRGVPILWALGTAQEWGQKKGDVRKSWISNKGWGRDAGWPLSVLIEPGTGHFYCTDRMADYFGKYIDTAAKARLSDDGSPTLKPVPFDKGCLAWMPSPENGNPPVTPFAKAPQNTLNQQWYFSEELAKEAQAFATGVNWKAETQMPTVSEGENTKVESFTFQDSICKASVKTDSEFSLKGVMLDKIPEGFVGAGEKLAATPGEPELAWISGPMAPLGNGKFKIALDRTWKNGTACYLVVKKEASDSVRYSLQPFAVDLLENKEGAAQKITFDKIQDVKAGAASIPLSAKSDSGLPVQFFVQAGPAIVKDGRLVLTEIPPRTKFPVEVTVAAWQWGSPAEPKVKTAEIIKQTFQILPSGK